MSSAERLAESTSAPLTSLIGRDGELARCGEMLRDADSRLVTVTGPPGVGKTRLALSISARLADEFADGTAIVTLAPVTDTRLVAPTIARSLGVGEAEGAALLERLKLRLHEKELLLVLDNFEQVIRAAPLLTELVAASTQLKILVTSRERLRISPEHEFPLAPLDLPDVDRLPKGDALVRHSAIALFRERARAVIPEFEVTGPDAEAVAEICVRLDGLPLAIELAAARVNLLPPQAMRERLEHRLELLTGGPADAPARQKTLRDTIEWSHGLLDEAEQRLFARLSVFLGGWTLDAAEAVANPNAEGPPVLDGLASLVDKNLVRRVPAAGGEARFGMLETIREYGLERLAAGGEEEVIRTGHAGFYLRFAESAEPALTSSEQEAWLTRLEREHDNLRSALRFTLDRGSSEVMMRMAAALWRFWVARGHLAEGRSWCEHALAAGGGSPQLRARVICGAAFLAHDQARLDEARALFEEAIRLSRAVSDVRVTALALSGLGFVLTKEGDFDAARATHDEALALCRELGEEWLVAHLLERLGTTSWMDGSFDAAARCFTDSLAAFRALGDSQEAAFALASLGAIRVAQGRGEDARGLIGEALPTLREGGNPRPFAQALLYAGEMNLERGDSTAAAFAYREALDVLGPRGFLYGNLVALSGLARVAHAQGRSRQAAKLFGAADALAGQISGVLPAHCLLRHEEGVAAVRRALDEAEFDAAYAEGRRFSVQEAMDEGALAAASPAAREELTRREIEILQLVAEELTNREIAERLVVSVRTVHAHLRSIYRKLGVGSRTAAARRADELELF